MMNSPRAAAIASLSILAFPTRRSAVMTETGKLDFKQRRFSVASVGSFEPSSHTIHSKLRYDCSLRPFQTRSRNSARFQVGVKTETRGRGPPGGVLGLILRGSTTRVVLGWEVRLVIYST